MNASIERRLWVVILSGAVTGAATHGLTVAAPFARGDVSLKFLPPLDDWHLMRLIVGSLIWTAIAGIVWATTWQRARSSAAPGVWTSRVAALVVIATLAAHLGPLAFSYRAMGGDYPHNIFIPVVHQLTLEPGIAFWLVGLLTLTRRSPAHLVVPLLVASTLLAFLTPVGWRVAAGEPVSSEVLTRSLNEALWGLPSWLMVALMPLLVLPCLRRLRRGLFFIAWTAATIGVAAVALGSLSILTWGPLRSTMPEILALATPATWLVGVMSQLSREVESEGP